VGTTTSKSKSNSKSKESGSNLGLTVTAFAQLGFSKSTGYNWAETTEESLQTQATSNVNVFAPAGTTLRIEQVLGICGDITLRTSMLKISHTFKDNNTSCKQSDGYEVLVTCDATNSAVIFLSFGLFRSDYL
jgi:hypothetical protein